MVGRGREGEKERAKWGVAFTLTRAGTHINDMVERKGEKEIKGGARREGEGEEREKSGV